MNDLVMASLLWAASLAPSQIPLHEPGWTGSVVAQGNNRATIQDTSMTDRSYRPFHFYGNTVRRVHYRGNPLPLPSDLWNAWQALLQGEPY